MNNQSASPLLPSTKLRSSELDFVKGVLITLMVLFHLSYFVERHVALTEWVYTFHMSGFLVISGFLFNAEKDWHGFGKTLRSIAVPYVVFEVVYLVALGVLGSYMRTNNHIELSPITVLKGLAVAPVGTYWYLHTLLICMAVCYGVNRLRLNAWNTVMLGGSALCALSLVVYGLEAYNVAYFLIGWALRRYGGALLRVVKPSLVAAAPVVLITLTCTNLHRATLPGVALTLSMMSLLCGVYRFTPPQLLKAVTFLGKNSLCIVLFSSFFTVCTKLYVRFFAFDVSGMLWALVSTLLVVGLCLLMACLSDRMGLSEILMGRALALLNNSTMYECITF